MHTVFGKWPQTFDREVEICALAMPGRGIRFREPPNTDMKGLVQAAVAEVIELPADRVALFGDCSGSIIALAIAKELQKVARKELVHLFAAGIPDPTIVDPRPRHILSDEDFRKWAVQEELVPPFIIDNPIDAEYFLGQIRADFRLVEMYQAEKTRIDCPITTFVGLTDHLAEISFDAWETQTSNVWQHHVLNCGHIVSADPEGELRSTIDRILNHTRE
jgi:medium-chain acyl-[acyl-carrier-protein] hydrolase